MPPLILAAGVIFIGYSAFKFFKAARLKAEADLAAVRADEPKDLGTLVQDPITGEYKAKN